MMDDGGGTREEFQERGVVNGQNAFRHQRRSVARLVENEDSSAAQ
jgi:hypothetical protein